MANCTLTSGIPLACQDNTGGVKNVYIAAYSDSTTFTYDSDDIIDAVTSSETFYTFKFRPQTAGFTEELTKSLENGTTFTTQTLTMMFHKMDAAKRNNMLLLAKTSMHVIVETQNGDYWLMGVANGADVSAQTNGSGLAYGDKNGYDLTITALEPVGAHNLDATAFASLTVSA
tara:strand:- start:1700 stop:2218 length:519 start_codon:yes stop_codon:yes gene_type:complete